MAVINQLPALFKFSGLQHANNKRVRLKIIKDVTNNGDSKIHVYDSINY